MHELQMLKDQLCSYLADLHLTIPYSGGISELKGTFSANFPPLKIWFVFRLKGV